MNANHRANHSDPNSIHWQDASLKAASTLSKMLVWKDYDAFFSTLEGKNHAQIAQACQAKIAELRRPRVRREYSRRTFSIGVDDRGNKIEFMENSHGTWTNLYAEIIVPAEFVERHYAHLLQTA